MAAQRMRFGYRRLTAMLAREGKPTNHKRVYRLYCEEGLAMRIRQRRRIRWSGGGAKPIGVAVDLYKYAVYQDANWDWKTMDYDRAIAKAVKETDPVLYADPNLTEFLKQGGKLMMYIGASEYHSFLDMESYYNTVMKNAGAAKKDQVRLFVVDGMGHCGGGAGADTFEKLGTIDQWVETGKAPDQLPSSKMSQGKVAFSRPLCAYPAVARYRGTGDINDAANFTCAK